MVRHEAAEALGAIGANRSRSVLQDVHSREPLMELVETCRLALDVMDWRQKGSDPAYEPAVCACMLNPYSSVDPAPPHPSHQDKSPTELGMILLDDTLPMFARYRAMFSLRNKGGSDCVRELCTALTNDTSSALLRHEVAYVLGQMQHDLSVEALETALRRPDEHDMVRHEAAEALGAIEGRWETVERILEEFSRDDNVVVKESCLVALDAADYWNNNNNNNHEETLTADTSEDVGTTVKDDDHPDKEQSASFVQQKNERQPPNRVMVNHFNVKQ